MDDKKKKSLFPTADDLKKKEKAKINEILVYIKKITLSRWQLIELTIENAEVTKTVIIKDDLPAIVLGYYDRMIRGAKFHGTID